MSEGHEQVEQVEPVGRVERVDRVERVELECSVDRLIAVRQDGYTAARLTAADGTQLTASGRALSGVQPGETVRVRGEWVTHAKFGLQLAVSACEPTAPSSVRAIRLYLASGIVRGIGPKLAAAIVEAFGADTLQVIDETPERLLEVNLIGPGRKDLIVDSWIAHKQVRELMVMLQGYGIGPSFAVKIYGEFGDASAEVVAKDPYRLIEAVRGIGFTTADKIALASGIPEDSPVRIRAAVLDRLDAAAAVSGHCFLQYGELLAAAGALLEQDQMLVRQAVDALAEQRRIVIETGIGAGQAVYERRMWDRERRVAAGLVALATAASDMPRAVVKRLEALESGGAGGDGDALHPQQLAAVRMALTNTVSVLTGGPGCGKSRTVDTIAALVRAGGGKVTLAAPTGKAAKRLAQLTGHAAMTVHRLVADKKDGSGGSDPGALFDDDPLYADLVVVDEASMLDVSLAAKLASGLVPGSHLLLVGDEDQLPSIGAGRVLADLLRVPRIPHTRLSHVFRQAAGSSITTNAHLIRQGRPPVLHASPGFWFEDCDDPAAVADRVVEIATDLIPAKHGVDHTRVQVLCPSRKGRTGTIEIGQRIQEKLNPAVEGRPEHWSGAAVFRVGDAVIQIRNDYFKGRAGVFNGTTGTVTAINTEDRTLRVLTEDGESVDYGFEELEDLLHAYAISVHRSQGSEYPYVVAPITTESGGLLLRRALLYTLVTRAKTSVILVGQRKALRLAVEATGQIRNTGLSQRVGAAFAQSEPDAMEIEPLI
ncbi:MAG: ATP-dependent RecD-like DNA helicase [Catenulisporales bacterium]|nr:ATP-dependent RecD-like DNA helicase [Catenulisporales bacterium]